MTNAINICQERFEYFHILEFSPVYLEKMGEKYKYSVTQKRWEMWQAAYNAGIRGMLRCGDKWYAIKSALLDILMNDGGDGAAYYHAARLYEARQAAFMAILDLGDPNDELALESFKAKHQYDQLSAMHKEI